MKSSYIATNDRLMGPSELMDPIVAGDCASSKDIDNFDYDSNEEYFNTKSLEDLIDLDLVTCSDSQLEEFILNSDLGLCDDSLPFSIIDEELRKLSDPTDLKSSLENAKIESQSDDQNVEPMEYIFHEKTYFDEFINVANFEEIGSPEFSDCKTSLIPLEVHSKSSVSDINEDESVKSSYQCKRNEKEKNRNSQDSIFQTSMIEKKKRNLNDRIKYQNKVAAMRYRMKKREEKLNLEDILQKEEQKYRDLKTKEEELKVHIDVMKELLSNCITIKNISILSNNELLLN